MHTSVLGMGLWVPMTLVVLVLKTASLAARMRQTTQTMPATTQMMSALSVDKLLVSSSYTIILNTRSFLKSPIHICSLLY